MKMSESEKEYPPYKNEPMSDDELVELLLSRGLMADRKELTSIISSVGYYRLKGYLLPFKNADDTFKPNTDISKVWGIYTFDRRLRLVVMDALARIEVALRAAVVREHLAANPDPFGYVEAKGLPQLRADKHAAMLKKIAEAAKNAEREPPMMHLRETYGIVKYPPLWIMIQLIPFGTLMHYYQGLPLEVQQRIANQFGVRPLVLSNWIMLLKKVRNICAHHGRLWNRHIDSKMSRKIGSSEELKGLDEALSKQTQDWFTSVFSFLSLVNYLLSKIRPESQWGKRCTALMAKADSFVLRGMGVPEDWRTLGLWKKV